jgi:hypothetical protein
LFAELVAAAVAVTRPVSCFQLVLAAKAGIAVLTLAGTISVAVVAVGALTITVVEMVTAERIFALGTVVIAFVAAVVDFAEDDVGFHRFIRPS